ncbi:hypothetical protein R5R35_008423 [Gryllus longicercus]|uniref:Uncharacterized protein n=1 Tax=Gryllus longicercus TaxID=2509291 RepID=A0AAN9W230_9ORTH
MVEIDSSESSSDEEDRRLKPIRRLDGPGFTSRTRVFDAAEQPEGSAPPEFFLSLGDEQDMQQLVAAYQKQNISELASFRGNLTEPGCPEGKVEQNLSKELISLSRKFEKFSLKLKQIPQQSLAARNLHVGLQLVKEYLSAANENIKFDKNINSCDIYGYSGPLQNSEPYDEWFSPVGIKEQCALESEITLKTIPDSYDSPTQKNASSQTNISGEVIPREASAALEFFQELIKKG